MTERIAEGRRKVFFAEQRVSDPAMRPARSATERSAVREQAGKIRSERNLLI